MKHPTYTGTDDPVHTGHHVLWTKPGTAAICTVEAINVNYEAYLGEIDGVSIFWPTDGGVLTRMPGTLADVRFAELLRSAACGEFMRRDIGALLNEAADRLEGRQ